MLWCRMAPIIILSELEMYHTIFTSQRFREGYLEDKEQDIDIGPLYLQIISTLCKSDGFGSCLAFDTQQ